MKLSVIQYSILLECSRFLEESNNIPMYKAIKNNGKPEDKFKIRLKNQDENYFNSIDNSIKYKNFKNRSLTTYTNIEYIKSDYDLYYVFIPDKYNCIYTKDNLKLDLKTTFDTIKNNIVNANESFEELLHYSYGFNDLSSAININDEIIFYNIPYYYVILANKPYEEILAFYGNI